MGQKAYIINQLRMMGYTVLGNSGIYTVYLRTNKGVLITHHVDELELELGISIIDEIVFKMNTLIMNNF